MTEASSEGAPARVRAIGEYVPLVDGPDKVSGPGALHGGPSGGRRARGPHPAEPLGARGDPVRRHLRGGSPPRGAGGGDRGRLRSHLRRAPHRDARIPPRPRPGPVSGRGGRGGRGGRRCDRRARPRPHPGRGRGAARVLHGRSGARPRRDRPPREAPRQPRAGRRVRDRGPGRGACRRRPRAGEDLPLRRGLPGPDGDARRPRGLRPGAGPAHRAREHPGPLLRPPDARALPRPGEVADPGGQASHRGRLRLPHRDPPRRDRLRSPRPQGGPVRCAS